MSDLAKIKTFKQLLTFLEEELDWPIDEMEIDDLTFDYDPEDDLGLDPKTAAKIKAIKQLRPLKDGQPFGIFFVEFEPKRLPVTSLRRILGRLVTKKRSSANPSDRQTWSKDDLIFASVYGDDEHRRIDFAHFADDAENGLPTLRVLGWDGDDTARKLNLVEGLLKEKLTWRERESTNEWRIRWREAFVLRHREAITTSKRLAEALAHLAQRIRRQVLSSMEAESKTKGQLHKLHKSFQDSLIHDLDQARFADMYAQTIAYGLLSARMSRPEVEQGLNAEHAALMVPNTNPFLKELMEEFLRIGGRDKKAISGKGIDFDELGVNDVVELLRSVNVQAVIADFGRERPGEDPVIHFYEYFMQVYDKKEKVKRGVFYTPKPVVSFIVRSVDEILREEFGLPLGLADTTTWGEMAEREKSRARQEADDGARPFEIPKGVKPEDHFVQILDPATGTGTFLVETIDLIHKRMVEHWKGQGRSEAQIKDLWNEYVPERLLPRLYGFELMMAPYAIAHMKIGLKLGDTGYRFQSEQRLRVFLTNSLEPPTDLSEMLEFVAPFLAHEARAANVTKASLRTTVIIGNPPYAAAFANASRDADGTLTMAGSLVERYKRVDGADIGEVNPKVLHDDYVKFLALCEANVRNAGVGLIGMITNHGYIDNPVFRGMRWHLLTTFSRCTVIDLHGNARKHERTPEGVEDENVFDIQQGVAIALLRRNGSASDEIAHGDFWGARNAKYSNLCSASFKSLAPERVRPGRPHWLLRPEATELRSQWEQWGAVSEMYTVGNVNFVTHRDDFAIAFSRDELVERAKEFRNLKIADSVLTEKYGLHDNRDWSLTQARRTAARDDDWESKVVKCLYRPFDVRWCWLATYAMDFPRLEVMGHLRGGNLALLTTRQATTEEFNHAFVTQYPSEFKCVSHNRNTSCFPVLALGRQMKDATEWSPNLRTSATVSECRRLFAANYAMLHSPSYRVRYGSMLKSEFPRLPAPGAMESRLAALGESLVRLHLLDFELKAKMDGSTQATQWSVTTSKGGDKWEVLRVGEKGKTMAPSPKGPGFGRVYINDTAYFDGVPEAVWKFHIGGYQVCHKWLSDRKGRTLTDEDIAHYHKVVIALNETIRIMGEIDEVIEEHGGWPGAFITDPAELEKLGIRPSNSGGSAPPAGPTRATPNASADADEADSGKKDGPELPFA